MLKPLKNSLLGAAPDYSERWNRIANRFDVLGDFTEMALEGICRAMIVSGPAGLGKSFCIEQALEKWDPTGDKHTISKGYVRPTGLLKLAYRHKEPGQVLIFDDSDFVFADETSLNLLKAMCDTCEERHVSWLSERALEADDGSPIPSRFEFEGSVIFLTNYDFDEMIERDTKWSPHFKALLSRSHYIDTALKDRMDYLIRIEMVIQEGLLNFLKPNERDEVWEFICEHAAQLREVSLRIAIKIGSLRQMKHATDIENGEPKWSRMARITCLKEE